MHHILRGLAISVAFATGLSAQNVNLALNKPAFASSFEKTGTEAGKAVDGNGATRWSSKFSDPQWICIDLGAVYRISRVKIVWENSNAKEYQIQLSSGNDENDFTTMVRGYKAKMKAGARTDDLTTVSGTGRYIRMYGIARNANPADGKYYGYSLYSFEVYGTPASNYTITTNCIPAAGGSISLNPAGGSYAPGTAVTATATPATGYTFTTWSGSTCGTVSPISFPMNSSKKLTANFALKSYTITASAGANGTISPSGPVAVKHGLSQTFTISTVSSDYAVNTVTVDGANIGAPTTYTFTNVTANHTIAVTFKTAGAVLVKQPVSTSAASSAISASTLAHDNNTATRWESTQKVDPQWIRYDMGSSKPIRTIVIDWEAANAKNYTIEGSDDVSFATKTTLVTKTNMASVNHRIDSITGLTGTYRYYRVYGTVRNLTYGYSIWETRFYTIGNAAIPVVANAGPDQTVNLGLWVTLDGSRSYDPAGGPQPFTLAWRQVSGPATVTLFGPCGPTPNFFPTTHGVYTFELSVTDGATTATDQVVVTIAFKPSATGPFAYDRVVYATPNLDYGALAIAPVEVVGPSRSSGYYTEQSFAEYDHFYDANYETEPMDFSNFNFWGGSSLFPFIDQDGTNVPKNGVFYQPVGDGPFPIIFFLHGNHHPLERSEPGYEGLCQMAASQGMLGVTVDENYLNGFYGGPADDLDRAILLLEHIKQFRIWNETSGHPLFGKIDMDNIMLVGHSRGGESVAIAAYYNAQTNAGITHLHVNTYYVDNPQLSEPVYIDGRDKLGPYQFNIKAVVGIAPTEFQFTPIAVDDSTTYTNVYVTTPYYLINGGRDWDVGNLSGRITYDFANPFNPREAEQSVAAVKGHLYLHNANHNFFNTVWSAIPDGNYLGSSGITYNLDYQLSSADQYEALKCFVGAISQSALRGVSGYQRLLTDKALCAATLPVNSLNEGGAALPIVFNTQYQDDQRLLVNHYEEDIDPASASIMPNDIQGTNLWSAGLTIGEEIISQNYYDPRTNSAVTAAWLSSGATYTTTLSDPLPLSAPTGEAYTTVAVRVGFSCSQAQNDPAVNQNFSLRLKDFAGKTYSVAASATSTAVVLPKQSYYTLAEQTVQGMPYPVDMQTIRFPLATFSANGVNTAAISEMTVVFDKTAKGKLYIDDIQLTR
jgi:hypothetical protein